eukprot:6829048-Prymnesium_polylepis.1
MPVVSVVDGVPVVGYGQRLAAISVGRGDVKEQTLPRGPHTAHTQTRTRHAVLLRQRSLHADT